MLQAFALVLHYYGYFRSLRASSALLLYWTSMMLASIITVRTAYTSGDGSFYGVMQWVMLFGSFVIMLLECVPRPFNEYSSVDDVTVRFYC